MSQVDGLLVAPATHRTFYPRVLRAYVAVLDAGKPPTFVNLGTELGVSRQAVQQMFLRHPDLLPWINKHLTAASTEYLGAVVRKTAFLAMQGSSDHIKLYLTHLAGGFARREMGETEPGVNPGGMAVQVNLLVPRPEYPKLEDVPRTPEGGQAIDLVRIPKVLVPKEKKSA